LRRLRVGSGGFTVAGESTSIEAPDAIQRYG